MKTTREKYGLLVIGIFLGLTYGLLTRIIFGERATLASISYLFLIPTVLGMVPLMLANYEQLKSYRNLIFIPWLTVGTFFLTMVLVGLEGFLCLMVLAAPFIILASIGAFIFRLIQIRRDQKKGKYVGLLMLPFLLSPLEQLITSPSATYDVTSTVVIASGSEEVWLNIIEVDSISEHEYNGGWFHDLGIPRPISATVDTRGVGGQRIGHFEGGLIFMERITHYDALHAVSFDIQVDPNSVGEKVFDQHVLNGNYFQFVNATYRLTARPHREIVLELKSSYQLTSKINFYGKLWGDVILKDFQNRLLEVIKRRCESTRVSKLRPSA
ncbi:MAG TPA: hypothetical protein VK658_09690 [Chryseolinea sp.]|nr:hypothetical protein [Chryseolinea sp.]